MTRIHLLLNELSHEAATTRKHLARLPEARLAWRPHPRSSSAGQLASHLIDCIRWVQPTFSADELDFNPATHQPFEVTSVAAMLAAFDREVEGATQAMARSTDLDARQPWRLRMRGKVWFEKPREAVFRDMTLSHLIHHRGQLSVYLRLLEVPVPGSYGPTADDRA